jgi:O-antigen/teichoic acid export membrane protein
VSDLTPPPFGAPAAEPPLLPRLARNASAQFAARLAASLAQAVALVLVARAFGPETYGLFAIVTTLTVMVTVVAEWGLPLIATRLVVAGGAARRELLAALVGLRLALGVLAAAVVVVLSFASSDSRQVHLGALVAGLSYLPLAWLGSVQIQAQLDLRLERVAWAALAGGVSGLAWTLSALVLDATVAELAGGILASATAAAAVGLLLTPSGIPLRPRVDRALWRRLLRDSTPLAVAYGFVSVYFYVDIALLARLSSSEQVGLYDAAYRFMFLGILIPGAIVSSVYALAAELALRDRARFAHLARELLSLCALGIPLPLIALCADPDALLRLLYGDAYSGGASALRVLGIGVALLIASGVVGPLLITLRQERATLRISIVAAVLNIALNLALIPSLDALGSAIATVATELTVLLPATFLLLRRGGVTLDIGQLARVAAAGCGGLVVALLVGGALLGPATGLASYVALGIATGALSRRQLEMTRSPEGLTSGS